MRDKSLETIAAKIMDELKKARLAQKISHEKLAALTGLSRSAISFIESHQRTPTILTCLKIAKALGVRLGDILNRIEKS